MAGFKNQKCARSEGYYYEFLIRKSQINVEWGNIKSFDQFSRDYWNVLAQSSFIGINNTQYLNIST